MSSQRHKHILRFPTAAILAVGDELLEGCQDTNGPALSESLEARGVEIKARLVLPDDLEIVARRVREELQQHALVLLCGGLGPTQDDITRAAVAQALGLRLEFVPAAWRAIQARFRRMRWVLPENNRVQAMMPHGAQLLPNARGTAPGFLVRSGKRWIAALPGPPHECLAMFARELLPRLQQALKLRGRCLHRVGLRTCGLGESALQEILGPAFARPGLPELGFLLDEPGEILVKLTVRDPDPRRARMVLRRGRRLIQDRLGLDVVGDAAQTLPAVVGSLLAARRQTLAIAESCTGGLLSRSVTSVAGSSRYFREGIVAYANAAKIRHLGVSPALLARHGAVSEATAAAMAAGLRRRSGADWTLAVTGVAGPGGGTRAKPVGTVCFGLAGPGCRPEARTLHFLGGRDLIQRRSATLALDWLRRRLKTEN
jgi:nicotinamide-nucleotide amidase